MAEAKIDIRPTENSNEYRIDIYLYSSNESIRNIKLIEDGFNIDILLPLSLEEKGTVVELDKNKLKEQILREYYEYKKKKELEFNFSLKSKKEEYNVIMNTGLQKIMGAKLFILDENSMAVSLSNEVIELCQRSNVDYNDIVHNIKRLYKKEIDKCNLEGIEVLKITLCKRQLIADVSIKFLKTDKVLKGFYIEKNTDSKNIESFLVKLPIWMKKIGWRNKKYTWQNIQEYMSYEYKKFIHTMQTVNKNLSCDNQNDLGRILNAEKSPLVFYPRTILKEVEMVDDKITIDLVDAISQGEQGGLGPFEISILSCINKFQFLLTSEILDLARGGYIDFGWRKNFSPKLLRKSLHRMLQYGLITIYNFAAVNQNYDSDFTIFENYNESQFDAISTTRVYSMSSKGYTLLKELELARGGYNRFEKYLDGNTIKKRLICNQWIIYWLINAKEQIRQRYFRNSKFFATDLNAVVGVKLAGVIIFGQQPMICEPVRRVEKFEQDTMWLELAEKFKRICAVFKNINNVRYGYDKFIMKNRPIIVFLCEDEEHIKEVKNNLCDLFTEEKDQKIWFTTDLKIFNYGEKGKRFLEYQQNDTLKVIDRDYGIDF